MEWIESLMTQYGRLRLAREAKDLDDSQKLLATDREAVRAHHRRTLGEHFREQGDGEDMIHIGDQHQHYHGPRRDVRGLSALAKLGVAAGLLATGAGGGAAVVMLLDALRPQAEGSAVERPADRDMLYELRLGPPR